MTQALYQGHMNWMKSHNPTSTTGGGTLTWRGTVFTYRMFGMDTSEDFLYHSNFFRPTYQWIAMMKTIVIDARYVS